MKSRMIAVALVITGAIICGFFGYVGAVVGPRMPKPENYPFLAERVAAPHHVPPFAGGASLRFAMVHDVLHERFPQHGPAWYVERNRRTLEQLSQHPEPAPVRWALIDDLAVGLDRLGRPEEAIPVLREKLAQQEAAGLSGRDLYTTLANLGTMLIHANVAGARSGDAEAMAALNEGIQLIRQSVQVHPGAHFGRERWQAAIAEFLRASFADPSLLQEFDCIGNRLDQDAEVLLDPAQYWAQNGYARPNTEAFSRHIGPLTDFPAFLEDGIDYDDPSRWQDLQSVRDYITRTGAEYGWEAVDVPSHREPVPFDEPVLGIIGMWRQGGGANPHFALALGEIMLRVGQRYLAWNAFERAAMLAHRFSPDPELQEFLTKHCLQRQAAIEASFQPTAPATTDQSPPTNISNQLRSAFADELHFGQQFQSDYQKFEAERIELGHAIDEPAFHEDFDRDRQPIASSVGLEDTVLLVQRPVMKAFVAGRARASAMLSAGIGAMIVACLLQLREKYGRQPINTNPSFRDIQPLAVADEDGISAN